MLDQYFVLFVLLAVAYGTQGNNLPTDVTVHALHTKSLEVRWNNPKELSSSKAIAQQDGKEKNICDGSKKPSSADSCTIPGLDDSATYSVWVEVCHKPATDTSSQEQQQETCEPSQGIPKKTLSSGPPPPFNLAVLAVRTKELHVSWTEPDLEGGKEASFSVIAQPNQSIVTNCSAGNSAHSCVLSNLQHSTNYVVSVKHCVNPPNAVLLNVSVYDWCSDVTAGKTETLAPTPENASNLTLEAVHRKALTVSWVNPNSTYGKLVSATATAMPHNQTAVATNCSLTELSPGPATCVLSDLEDFTQYDVMVQVCVSPKDAAHFQGPLDPWCSVSETVTEWTLPKTNPRSFSASRFVGKHFTLPLDIFTNKNVWSASVLLTPNQYYVRSSNFNISAVIKLDPVGAIVGGTLACLVVLAAVVFVVFWMGRRRRRRSSEEDYAPDADYEEPRVEVNYKLLSEPTLEREKIPPPISLHDFNAYIGRLKSKDALRDEFERLEELTGKQKVDFALTSLMASLEPALNRYVDMMPYDQNIVRLDRDWSTYCKDQEPVGPLVGEVQTVFINASYVKACSYDALGRAEVASKSRLPEYIATQAPLTHTEADFLYMVHQQRSPVVIMLCNIQEGGKSKCAQYWPDREGIPDEKRSLTRTVTVTLEKTTKSPFMVTRVLTVQPEGNSEPWTFTQLHFLGWADLAVPDLKEFYEFYHTFKRQKKPLSEAVGPTIVHCSAGVGRTGTLICADMLLNQLRKNPSQIDVFGTVLASRVFRCHFVQVKEQLRFLYEFLAHCITVEGLAKGRSVKTFAPPLPMAPNDEYDLPKQQLPSGPSLAQPFPSKKTAARLPRPAAPTEEYSLPKRPPPSGPSVGQPSRPSNRPMPLDEVYDFPKGTMPTRGALRTAPAPPAGKPPRSGVLQEEVYSLPKRALPSVQRTHRC